MQWTYTPSRSPTAKVQRRVVQWRRACTAEVAPDRPVITFTFDDFPKVGPESRRAAAWRARRFYACTSMMGMRSRDGRCLTEHAGRVVTVATRSAHSHTHLDCSRRGRRSNAMAKTWSRYRKPDTTIRSLRLPTVSYSAKRWVNDVFTTGIRRRERGEVDRSQLRAVELGAYPQALAAIILPRDKWLLLFFTHDVARHRQPMAPVAD
jgi:hypothetical protein